jgi:Kef-type K+ transport system membrane component KefB
MKTVALYVIMLSLFVAGICWALQSGADLEASGRGTAITMPAAVSPPDLLGGIEKNAGTGLGRLLVQILAVLLATRLVGGLFRRWRQPVVVGEIVAGILLGPSLLGWLWPAAWAFVFPPTSLETMGLLSQIGVCLFMFVVGLEFDAASLRRRAHVAVLISHISIIFPFFLGVLSALWLFVPLAPRGAAFAPFALFMGIAMSITAFPVLARMLAERSLTGTPLGATAITCAAVDDITAWSILAFIVVFARGGSSSAVWFQLGLLLIYLAFMLGGVRPYLAKRLGTSTTDSEALGTSAMVAALIFVLGSALVTEALGVHALFGAFLAGAILPRGTALGTTLRIRLETICSAFLLPLFFAVTGLKTQIGLLQSVGDWVLVLAVVLLAVTGKLAGSLLAARCAGVSWLDAFRLGVLMNTRGLMELIALNIGYDLGILPTKLFTALVLMALITTFLTGPLMNLADAWERRRAPALETV